MAQREHGDPISVTGGGGWGGGGEGDQGGHPTVVRCLTIEAEPREPWVEIVVVC